MDDLFKEIYECVVNLKEALKTTNERVDLLNERIEKLEADNE